MAIWNRACTLDELRQRHVDTAEGHLGIEFTEIGEDWLAARMPVDARTVQPFRILHGGASVLLAESVGSCAANMCVDQEQFYCVGLDINANHVRGAKSGWVTGTARPLHIGKSTHVWQIRITNEAGALVCISRLTMSVLRREAQN
ncbi:MAG: hotdog fold thioesterase [Noviherbaspirillum sp.]